MRVPTKQELSTNIQRSVKAFRKEVSRSAEAQRPAALPAEECVQDIVTGNNIDAPRQLDMDVTGQDMEQAAGGGLLITGHEEEM